jgi:hypothetical protein
MRIPFHDGGEDLPIRNGEYCSFAMTPYLNGEGRFDALWLGFCGCCNLSLRDKLGRAYGETVKWQAEMHWGLPPIVHLRGGGGSWPGGCIGYDPDSSSGEFGVARLSVKTDPRLWSWQQWRRLLASLPCRRHRRRRSRRSAWATPEETLDMGLLDQMMASPSATLPARGIVLVQGANSSGPEVEQRGLYNIIVSVARRLGAAGSQRADV